MAGGTWLALGCGVLATLALVACGLGAAGPGASGDPGGSGGSGGARGSGGAGGAVEARGPTGQGSGGSAVEGGRVLSLYAASSLTEVSRAIARRFEVRGPATRVAVNAAGSSTLVRQVAAGAPADLLWTADVRTMDRAQREGLVDASSRADILGNRLVLVVPAGRGDPPRRVEDLVDPRFAILAGCDPAVPAGAYAREVLAHHGIRDAVQGKMTRLESVRGVLGAVATGAADAGFVYATDALGRDRVVVALEIPSGDTSRIVNPIAIVARSHEKDLARSFLAFLASREVADLVREAGFEPLLPAGGGGGGGRP